MEEYALMSTYANVEKATVEDTAIKVARFYKFNPISLIEFSQSCMMNSALAVWAFQPQLHRELYHSYMENSTPAAWGIQP